MTADTPLPLLPETLEGAPVTVMGIGLFGGGAAAARWCVERGARVTATDLRDARTLGPALDSLADLELELVLGEHRARDFERTALVVANPAVPPESAWLARARAAGVPVTSEFELFLAHAPGRIALVSGTNGKSSTVHALHQLLSAAGLPAHLGGNIGSSLLGSLETIGADDRVVLEVSSYQLEALPPPPFRFTRAPRVALAALTNVSADHLERHGTPAAYAAAKARVFELLGARGTFPDASARAEPTALLPAGLAGREPYAGRIPPGATVVTHGPGARLARSGGRFTLDGEDLGAERAVALPGAFQLDNVLVALGAARLLGAPAAALREALPGLRGLAHRLEDLGLARGVRVVDNGVSTTPESTLAALRELSGAVTLLCGGEAKRGLDWTPLAREAVRRGARVVAFGAAAGTIAEALGHHGAEVRATDTLDEAVGLAFGELRSPTLLFSPACASFDAYANFRARALAFRALVERAGRE